jgi:hypothetical protein
MARQVSSKRLLFNSLKAASIDWALPRHQPRPGRFKRQCTSVMAALSTVPLPIGRPAARYSS